jgi:hypothetical protein
MMLPFVAVAVGVLPTTKNAGWVDLGGFRYILSLG